MELKRMIRFDSTILDQKYLFHPLVILPESCNISISYINKSSTHSSRKKISTRCVTPNVDHCWIYCPFPVKRAMRPKSKSTSSDAFNIPLLVSLPFFEISPACNVMKMHRSLLSIHRLHWPPLSRLTIRQIISNVQGHCRHCHCPPPLFFLLLLLLLPPLNNSRFTFP